MKKPNKMKVYDSNGPDVRIRGTAYQVTEKYMTLAKDAETSGDMIMAENYRQHAEHYQRIINTFADEAPVSADAEQQSQDEEDDLSLPASITGEQSASEREMAVA